MNQREDTHLLSGAYALDAVAADEAALVEAAMADSEELRGEITGLSDTAVALGLAVPPVTPPPALRARILDAIEDLPQEAPEPVAEVAQLFPPATATAMPTGTHAVPQRRRRMRRRPAVLIALATAAVLLFSGGFLVQRTMFDPSSQVPQIAVASDVHTAKGGITGGGTATVYWSRSEHQTAVVLTGVTAPAGKVLQLWSMRGNKITDAGLYQPTSDQNYAVITGTPNPGERIAVSVEPAGGSSQPTTTPIAVVSLST